MFWADAFILQQHFYTVILLLPLGQFISYCWLQLILSLSNPRVQFSRYWLRRLDHFGDYSWSVLRYAEVLLLFTVQVFHDEGSEEVLEWTWNIVLISLLLKRKTFLVFPPQSDWTRHLEIQLYYLQFLNSLAKTLTNIWHRKSAVSIFRCTSWKRREPGSDSDDRNAMARVRWWACSHQVTVKHQSEET